MMLTLRRLRCCLKLVIFEWLWAVAPTGLGKEVEDGEVLGVISVLISVLMYGPDTLSLGIVVMPFAHCIVWYLQRWLDVQVSWLFDVDVKLSPYSVDWRENVGKLKVETFLRGIVVVGIPFAVTDGGGILVEELWEFNELLAKLVVTVVLWTGDIVDDIFCSAIFGHDKLLTILSGLGVPSILVFNTFLEGICEFVILWKFPCGFWTKPSDGALPKLYLFEGPSNPWVLMLHWWQ